MVGRLIWRLEQLTMAVAVGCVVLLMLVVSADAVGRYVFASPLPWAFELISYYLLIVVTYGALSSTFQRGDHIHLDLIKRLFPKRLSAWLEVVYSLLAAVVFSLIAYGAWHELVESYLAKEFLPGYIIWPAWLAYLPIVIGAALLVMRLLHHSWMLARLGHDPAVETESESVE